MKFLKEIPSCFDNLVAKDLIGDSEAITEKDLQQIDKQVRPFMLEVVYFENGAALNWYIDRIRNERRK